jgi:outer membrane protein
MLKKITLLSLIACSSIFAKDTFFEVGGGYLGNSATGELTALEVQNKFNYTVYDNEGADSDSFYGYVDITEIPILPNIKLEYGNPSYSSNNLDSRVTVLGTNESKHTTGAYSIDTTEIGAYLYYDFFSFIDWASFDLGIGAKYIDYDILLKKNTQNITIYNDSDSAIIPLVYVHPDITIPYINVILEFQGKWITYEENKFYDYKAGVKYFFKTSYGDIGVEGGYYYSKIKTEDDNDLFNNLTINAKTDGLYTGMSYKF